MKIQTEVTDARISDLLCAAFEGGSNYWYEITKFIQPAKLTFRTDTERVFKHLDYPLNVGGALVIRSLEEPDREPARLNRLSIRRGLELLANSKDYGHHWADFLKENEDATTGDVFLQFCLYGEVIYG